MSKNKSTRMYPERKKNMGITEGCEFGCVYCAFQALQERLGRTEEDKAYIPHLHLERLNVKPPETNGDEFVTIGLNGDISAAPDEVMYQIIEYCKRWTRTTFLIQSKNPARFVEQKGASDLNSKFEFPPNVLLGATVETNYTIIPYHFYKEGEMGYPYSAISKAPPPEERIRALAKIKDNRVIVTVEPILDFDPVKFIEMIKSVRPFRVYIGYDSGRSKLPEPLLDKTSLLIDEIRKFTDVRLKLMREAWYK